MAFKSTNSLALFLTINLLFFTLATSCNTCPPAPKPPCVTPKPPNPTPKPPKPTPSPSSGKCPIDTLKLGVCANVLGLINLNLGKPPKTPCCSLLGNLSNLEAAVCLCTALKASVLGINLDVPIKLTLLLNYCGKKEPSGFQCA